MEFGSDGLGRSLPNMRIRADEYTNWSAALRLACRGCFSPCGSIVHFDPFVVASSMMPFRSTVKLIMQFLAWKRT